MPRYAYALRMRRAVISPHQCYHKNHFAFETDTERIHFLLLNPFCQDFKMATVTKKLNVRLANRPCLVSDFRTLWRSGLSARVSESQKLKTVG